MGKKRKRKKSSIETDVTAIYNQGMKLYLEEENETLIQNTLDQLNKQFKKEELDKIYRHFIDTFPPLAIQRHEIDIDTYEDLEEFFFKSQNSANAPETFRFLEKKISWRKALKPGVQ